MNIKNAIYKNIENTIVDVEIEHPAYGWIPYTFNSAEEDYSFDSEIREWLKMNTVSDYIMPTPVELQTSKVAEIKEAYSIANQEDIAYMSTTFQADKDSQDLIVAVLSAGSVPDGFFWLDSLNNQVNMTYVDLQGLSGEILARGQANFVKYQDLKGQIDSATSQADLDLVVW